MDQVGHVDPKVTLGIYAGVIRRGDEERDLQRALLHDGSEGAEEPVNGSQSGITSDGASVGPGS